MSKPIGTALHRQVHNACLDNLSPHQLTTIVTNALLNLWMDEDKRNQWTDTIYGSRVVIVCGKNLRAVTLPTSFLDVEWQ